MCVMSMIDLLTEFSVPSSTVPYVIAIIQEDSKNFTRGLHVAHLHSAKILF